MSEERGRRAAYSTFEQGDGLGPRLGLFAPSPRAALLSKLLIDRETKPHPATPHTY